MGGSITIPEQNIYEASTVQKQRLGTRLQRDDRVFRYVQCLTEALRPGKGAAMVMTPEESAVAGATTAVGGNTVTITVTAAAGLTMDELAGGYMCFRSTDWYSYKILSHPAADNAATCVITLDAEIDYAVTAGVTILTAYPSMWKVRSAATPSGGEFKYVGVPKCRVAVNSYAWIQTWGPCSVCPGAYLGADQERNLVWTIDGDIAADTIHYQNMGILMPDNYTINTAHTDLLDSNHLVYLMLCP